MKITPKPITHEDKVDHSRDIAGVNKWSRSSRTVSFIMFILGWFTIPVEVFLRKDFGQRWFTVVNFYAGFFLLLIFAGLQYAVKIVWDLVKDFFVWLVSSINPFYKESEPGFTDRLLDKSMLFFLAAYVLIGCYHLFRIKWRNRTNTALHSFDDGTSRLEPIAGYVIQVINSITRPMLKFYLRLLPKKQGVATPEPDLIQDRTAFTNTILEPLLLLILFHWTHGITSLWLFMSAVALAIHANWKENAKLNKILDFRDSIIEAKTMMELKNKTEQAPASIPMPIIQQAASTLKEHPEVVTQITGQYPDLMDIIETLNRDRSHLAN